MFQHEVTTPAVGIYHTLRKMTSNSAKNEFSDIEFCLLAENCLFQPWKLEITITKYERLKITLNCACIAPHWLFAGEEWRWQHSAVATGGCSGEQSIQGYTKASWGTSYLRNRENKTNLIISFIVVITLPTCIYFPPWLSEVISSLIDQFPYGKLSGISPLGRMGIFIKILNTWGKFKRKPRKSLERMTKNIVNNFPVTVQSFRRENFLLGSWLLDQEFFFSFLNKL